MYEVASSVRNAELVARRRPDIAASAFEVFRKRGFKTATTEEVAARMGIDKATLYGYINCKEDLLYLVFLHLIPPLTMRLVALAAKDDDPRRRLGALIEEQIHILDEWRDLVLLIYRELRHLPEPMLGSVIKLIRDHNAPYEQAIRDGIEAGLFVPLDPVVTANLLLSMLYTWATHQRTLGDANLETVSDTVRRLFFDGLLATPRRG